MDYLLKTKTDDQIKIVFYNKFANFILKLFRPIELFRQRDCTVYTGTYQVGLYGH